MSDNPAVGFPLDDYLKRIGLPAATLSGLDRCETVATLARAQHRRIPFENIDIHRGRVVTTDPAALVDRLIHGRRGGICYEVNGLLALALGALGVPARLYGARVDPGAGFGLPRGHVAVGIPAGGGRVQLADVGFSGELILGGFDPDLPETWTMASGPARYRLDPEPVPADGFAEMARWQSTAARSRFTGSVICTLPTRAGRRTLAGRIDPAGRTVAYRLISADGDRRTERRLTVSAATAQLAGTFGMAVTAPSRSRPAQA